MSLKELKKEYLEFLENVPSYLKKTKELLNKKYLDYSAEEVDFFVNLYLKHYKNPTEINLTYKELTNLLYAYLGTAFVNYNGGKWELNDVKTDEAYGTPTIVNWGGKDYPWSRISPDVWKFIIERDENWQRSIYRIFKHKTNDK